MFIFMVSCKGSNKWKHFWVFLTIKCLWEPQIWEPLATVRKLNVHKLLSRRPGCLIICVQFTSCAQGDAAHAYANHSKNLSNPTSMGGFELQTPWLREQLLKTPKLGWILSVKYLDI